MSLWLCSHVYLRESALDAKLNPKHPIRDILIRHKLGINSENTVMVIWNKDTNTVDIDLLNPDGYVDEIHEAFKKIKKLPFVSSIEISNHYY